jgi:hypothetical protein
LDRESGMFNTWNFLDVLLQFENNYGMTFNMVHKQVRKNFNVFIKEKSSPSYYWIIHVHIGSL